MKIVITGATGLLGANLALMLADQGHRPLCLKRPNSSTWHLEGANVEWVDGDIEDLDLLQTIFNGADLVFHCAALVSINRNRLKEMERVNIMGSRNVAEAAQRSGVRRLVYCSTVDAIGFPEGDGLADETTAWNHDKIGIDHPYAVTKYKAQIEMLEAAERGLDLVVVNPAFMLGPYDPKPSSGKMIVQIARKKMPVYTEGSNNFVDVRDVARGMILASQRGKKGETYILGGENLSYLEAFTRIARLAGVKPPAIKAPKTLSRWVGYAGDLVEKITGHDQEINSVSVTYGNLKRFFSSQKAVSELGYTITPIEKGITDALAWFRKHNMI